MNIAHSRNEKRVALVIGSTSGIGMAIAKQLATDGFTIAFHAKSSVEAGEELSEYPSKDSRTQAVNFG